MDQGAALLACGQPCCAVVGWPSSAELHLHTVLTAHMLHAHCPVCLRTAELEPRKPLCLVRW